jgi:hypothetical protein
MSVIRGRADFLSWTIRQGYQRFISPRTVSPGLLNAYGWIDVPKAQDLVIDLYQIAPGEQKTMYWHYESIVTQSTSPVRVTLEGNFTYDAQAGAFDPAGWMVNTGYAVVAGNGHQLVGTLIKTQPGDAMRLRIHATAGGDNDLYFKYIGCEVPWAE